MTSDESWSPKLRRIGEVELVDHTFLCAEDECFFFGEYTPSGTTGQAAWTLSVTNQKIANLKKHPSKRGNPEWYWKERTINELARDIRANIKPEFLSNIWFVPIPPSKPQDHPEYDSRMLDLARGISSNDRVVELLLANAPREQASQAGTRPSISELEANLGYVEGIIDQDDESTLILLDDVITTGATFCACRNIVRTRLPKVNIVGLFIARRVPLSGLEDFDW